MDFYSGRRPNLIGPVMRSTVCKVSKSPNINNTVSDKITQYFSNIYNDYIVDHKLIDTMKLRIKKIIMKRKRNHFLIKIIIF